MQMPRIDRGPWNERCLCWVAIAIRQIQRSIAAPLHHFPTSPVHHCTTEPLNHREDRGCSSPANLSFIDGSNLQLLVNYLRSRCRSQIPKSRHASVLITTKNNDRLRLLEAIWPATFSPLRSGFLFFFLLLNLFFFFW